MFRIKKTHVFWGDMPFAATRLDKRTSIGFPCTTKTRFYEVSYIDTAIRVYLIIESLVRT